MSQKCVRSLSIGFGAALCSGVLLISGAAAQTVYPRGDANCSAQLSAVDLVAAARGAGGSSVCGNDDCDRDGVVTPADLACAVGCLFGGCPVPPNAALVTGVVADSAPSLAPLSVIRLTVANLGDGALIRVTIADVEAQIVARPSPDTLLVMVPDIAPGPAEVVVHVGDLAGVPHSITLVAPRPVGTPDTLDGTLDLLHQALVGLGSLDLEAVYGEDANVVRGELARLRGALGTQRAVLAGDTTFTPQARAKLDATFDSSGLPEQLRQLLADIDALQAGGGGASENGGGAAVDGSVIAALGAAVVGAIAALVGATTTVPFAIAAIAAALVNSAGFLALESAGVTAPKILRINFFDRMGDQVGEAVENGMVVVYGERMFSTNLVMATVRAQTVLEAEASGAGSQQFRIPRGVYGVCGSAAFFLRRTLPPFAESNQIRSLIKPELLQIVGTDKIPGDLVEFSVRGVAGCDAVARFRGTAGTASVPTDYVSTTQTSTRVPALVPGDYEVSLRVGRAETDSLPLSVGNLVSGIRIQCNEDELFVGPQAPFRTLCFAKPLPLGVRVPVEFQTFRWMSSDSGTASVREGPTVEGLGTAVITAVAPGTTHVTAAILPLKVTSAPADIRVRDGSAPSVTVSAPGTADPGTSISVSVTATDNLVVSRLVLHATGDAVSTTQQEFPCQQLEKTCANSFSVAIKQTDFTQRQVTLVADAFDGVGNKGTSSAATVTINEPMPMDTSAPQLIITQPADGGTVNAGESRQVTVHAIDNQPGDSGIKRVVIDVVGDAVVGGGAHSDVTLPNALPDAVQGVPFAVKNAADLATVTNRTIVVTAAAFDVAGNTVSRMASVSVAGTLDTCDGGIQADPSRGYIGDAVTVRVAISGPAAERVTRVTSVNPGGSFELTKQGDVYSVTLFYQGTGAFTLSFTAFDAGGATLCSGSIGLESLGPRPGSGAAAAGSAGASEAGAAGRGV